MVISETARVKQEQLRKFIDLCCKQILKEKEMKAVKQYIVKLYVATVEEGAKDRVQKHIQEMYDEILATQV